MQLRVAGPEAGDGAAEALEARDAALDHGGQDGVDGRRHILVRSLKHSGLRHYLVPTGEGLMVTGRENLLPGAQELIYEANNCGLRVGM